MTALGGHLRGGPFDDLSFTLDSSSARSTTTIEVIEYQPDGLLHHLYDATSDSSDSAIIAPIFRYRGTIVSASGVRRPRFGRESAVIGVRVTSDSIGGPADAP